jgi:PhnB protein
MTPIPYLFFQGNCEAALTRYAQVFGSPPPDLMRVSSAPVAKDFPPEAQKKVMHGALQIDEGWLYASDDISGTTPAMQGTSVMVSFPTADKAKAAFDALAKDGDVNMAFAPTFWSAGFGTLTDMFGTKWMVGVDWQKDA